MSVSFAPVRFGVYATAPAPARSLHFGHDPQEPTPSPLPLAGQFRRASAVEQVAKLTAILEALGKQLDTLEERFPLAARFLNPLHDLLALGQATVANLHGLVGRDPLTGLANRQTYEGDLNQAFTRAQADRTPLTVMALDLDHFKQVNDTLGHDGGDIVLRAVGETLQKTLGTATGGKAKAYRIGGEEFVVLAPGLTQPQSAELAEAIRQAIESIPWESERRSIYKLNEAGIAYIRQQRDHGAITASIGMARADFADPQAASAFATGEALVKAADDHAYQAKKAGRNQVSL